MYKCRLTYDEWKCIYRSGLPAQGRYRRGCVAQAVKTALLEKRWMCGQPDTMLVLSVDHVYVITAYGEAGIIQTFKEKSMSVLKETKILMEAPIV